MINYKVIRESYWWEIWAIYLNSLFFNFPRGVQFHDQASKFRCLESRWPPNYCRIGFQKFWWVSLFRPSKSIYSMTHGPWVIVVPFKAEQSNVQKLTPVLSGSSHKKLRKVEQNSKNRFEVTTPKIRKFFEKFFSIFPKSIIMVC